MRMDSFQSAEKSRVSALSEELADLVLAHLAGIPAQDEERIIRESISFFNRLFHCELLISGYTRSIAFDNPLETIQTCRIAAQVLNNTLQINNIASFFAKMVDLLERMREGEAHALRESTEHCKQLQQCGEFAVGLWKALQEPQPEDVSEFKSAVRKRYMMLK